MPTAVKNYLALFSTIFFWASAFVGIRAGLSAYHPGSLALLRYAIASLCLLPLYFRLSRHDRAPPQGKDWLKIACLGIVGFSIYNVSLNYGEISVTAGIASFIVSLIPVGIVLLAWLVLKEPMRPKTWLGLSVSILGMVIIALTESKTSAINYHAGSHTGVGILVITALSGAIYSAFHKPLLKRYHPVAFTSYAIWFGTLFMAVYLPQMLDDMMQAPLHSTLAVVYLGIFPGAIGYLTWSYALRQIPAAKAGSFLYAMPLITTMLGWLVLGEVPAVAPLLGGLVALTGAAIVNWQKRSAKAS